MANLQKGYTDHEIGLIAKWLKDGLSATQIAGQLTRTRRDGVSRNAIVGIVRRNRRLAAIGFARVKPGPKGPRDPRPAATQPVRLPAMAMPASPAASFVTPASRAVPRAEARAYDAAARRVTLDQLAWRECRFPVNEALPGEAHLFCGLATDAGAYCAHHALRCGAGFEPRRVA